MLGIGRLQALKDAKMLVFGIAAIALAVVLFIVLGWIRESGAADVRQEISNENEEISELRDELYRRIDEIDRQGRRRVEQHNLEFASRLDRLEKLAESTPSTGQPADLGAIAVTHPEDFEYEGDTE